MAHIIDSCSAICDFILRMTPKVTLTLAAMLVGAAALSAQAPSMSYGVSINAETAKKVAAPAVAEARKNQWAMAVAIVDIAGDLVYFERMDDTQVGSVDVAIDKARSAARFKRPTKAFQDGLAAGGAGLRLLALNGAVPVEGGIPLVQNGKVVGAIGCSGGTSEQDGQCATAGANALK
jgi:uncharacterized protein GlcG (DUF336 family)